MKIEEGKIIKISIGRADSQALNRRFFGTFTGAPALDERVIFEEIVGNSFRQALPKLGGFLLNAKKDKKPILITGLEFKNEAYTKKGIIQFKRITTAMPEGVACLSNHNALAFGIINSLGYMHNNDSFTINNRKGEPDGKHKHPGLALVICVKGIKGVKTHLFDMDTGERAHDIELGDNDILIIPEKMPHSVDGDGSGQRQTITYFFKEKKKQIEPQALKDANNKYILDGIKIS